MLQGMSAKNLGCQCWIMSTLNMMSVVKSMSFMVVPLKAQCIVESKVAQERGLLTLEGSLDDDAALLVLASATDTAEAEPAPQEAPAVEEVAEEPPAMPEAAATSELPAEETVAPEEAVAPEEVAPPAEEPAPVEETVAPAVEEAVASVVENTAGDGEAGTGEVLSSTSSATDSCLYNPRVPIKILLSEDGGGLGQIHVISCPYLLHVHWFLRSKRRRMASGRSTQATLIIAPRTPTT